MSDGCKGRRQCEWLGASVVILGLAAQAAHAQAPAGTSASSSTIAEVVVTASRAAPTGFSAPTPTSVVSSDLIERQGSSNIAQVLNQIPAFKPTLNPAANGVKTQSPGASTADLRGLGSNRTLVLVDGMRVPPLAPTNTTGVTVSPDLNQIPSLMIDRIEVVTGGASAQWGSDAVAGVVNVILKNRFNGLELKVQGGESEHSDAREFRIGALAGTGFAGDRGHVVAGVDYVDDGGINDIYSRPWGRQENQLVANPTPNVNGYPANVIAAGVHASSSPGGLITGPGGFSLRNYEFLPGGLVQPFSFGQLAGGSVMIGGEGQSLAKGVSLAPSVRRLDPYLYAEYKVTDTVTAFLEGSYAFSRGTTTVLPSRDTAITIKRDNAYLPANVAAAMDAAHITSFTMSRLNYDLGLAGVQIENRTPHIAGGFKGDLGGGWTWDAHYGWGQNTYSNYVSPDRIKPNFAFATDAVVNNGQIVCRAAVPGAAFNPAAAGCAPIDLFGSGAPSAQAASYVLGVEHARAIYTQQSAAANLKGEPFSTWAGPVSIATGVEWRDEKEVATADPIAQAGNFEASNATAFSGAFHVVEGYVETVAPLLKDRPFAKSVDFNGAVRVADYSTAGVQTTWKAGGDWSPLEGLRLRFTRSKDIRAPALFELYSAGAISSVPVTIHGVTNLIPTNVTVGNPKLQPEDADTTTVGAVIEPPGLLRGLRVSVDYFDIKINKAITSLSATNVQNLCNLGQAFYCSAITLSANGAPQSMTLPVLNAATLQSNGVDFALAYRTGLANLGPGAPGRVTASFSGTYVDHTWVNLGNGGGRIDRAGENSQLNTYAIPHLRMNLSGTYELGPASVTAQVLYVSRGTIDNTYNTQPGNTINDNYVPAIAYLNLYGTYSLTQDGRLQLNAAINNLFDKAPPVVPSTTLFTPTNGAYYDTVGRAFQVGATYRF